MAARDSVVEVMADVVDGAGVHVQACTRTLRWSVSGPATLVGPPVCESDMDRKEQMEGTMYIVTPVSNLVRSNGQEGTITVRVEIARHSRGGSTTSAAACQRCLASRRFIRRWRPAPLLVYLHSWTADYAHDCTFSGTDVGIRMKSNASRGGTVEKIWYETSPWSA